MEEREKGTPAEITACAKRQMCERARHDWGTAESSFCLEGEVHVASFELEEWT